MLASSEAARLHRVPKARRERHPRMQPRPLFLLAALVFAKPGLATDGINWGKDVTAHFVEPHTREHVFAAASEKSKPVMVIAMTSWCGACAGLRASVNGGAKVRPLLDKFVVAYAMEEGRENVWTELGQDYVPQVYFYNSQAQQLHVYAESEKYKYYFADEVHLETAMLKAMDLVAKGSVGEALAAPTPAPSPATDGSTSPAPDPNVAVFDPAHAFDESIAGHFLTDLSPEQIRAKAIEANRPFMVMLTTSWCHACKDLIQSVNGGKETKDLLHAFVCLHAHGDQGLKDWQPENEEYVPQVLFFDTDGTLLDTKSSHPKYKNFYNSDKELAAGMALALDASKSVGEL